MSTPVELVTAKVSEIIALGKQLYNLDLSIVDVRLDLKGGSAGMAGFRGARGKPETRKYFVRLNYDLLMREPDQIINDTIGHEFAHTICQMNPALGDNHDSGWAKICRSFGSDANRTHTMEVVYGTGYTYEYTSKSGKTVRLSQQRHNAVSKGAQMEFRQGIGVVDRTCSYMIVGVSGRTLATPLPGRSHTVNSVVADARQSFIIGSPEALRTKHPKPANKPVKVEALRTDITNPSKADVARNLIRTGHSLGQCAEAIIRAIMLANGHSYGLAKSYYQNNVEKMGFSKI